MLVWTPSRVHEASARSSRRSAEGRSAPHAMTFASIGSYTLPTTSPASTPESIRTVESWRFPHCSKKRCG
ncbi:MAG: hypothetical protein JWN00_5179, partial [Actinomycetia bacterium]|nr:hypothetical protein [Actinomycetes bacterium]